MTLEETRPAAVLYGEVVDGPEPPPPRFTVGVAQQICENIKAGNRPVTAAQMAGIPQHVYYHWMKLGREGNCHCKQFVEDVEIACGQAEGKALKVIQDAMYDNPEHAKWYLERTRAAGYSKEVNEKVNAQLAEFVARLRDELPPTITPEMVGKPMYNIVVGILTGSYDAESAPSRFRLPAKTHAESTEDST